jgi:serine/threonine protein kinase/tetratricopeptide (TPR) repeat protein
MSDSLSDAETKLGPPGPPPREQIGPYKILQRIGEGGFGSVYEAEQEHPVKRRVAIKVIKLGMDTEHVIARFEAERQALAMMDHPHIARVIDAGATEAGRPYFVMDLVKGDPIAAYCDKQRMPIVERLALFEQVCSAVQHAHTKGIIHRDLKPSNILVSTQDGKPFARVIDFGIAKATSARLTDRTLFTELNQMIGTPVYMSPEQAEGNADIDTRTDVYSLGVVLYELLTGTTPLDPKALKTPTAQEVQRIIRDQDPPRPSARLSDSARGTADIAPNRRLEPQRLVSAVRGELDWIVMKAIEKDRSRRYETANGLAMDVRRFLAGEPVLAAPPSTAYRMRKFVRRHRAGLTVAGLAMALLVAFAVVAAVQNVRIRRERDVARREREKAEQVTRLLVSLFKVSDPSEGGGGKVTAREILDNGARQIPLSLADQPDVKASLLGTMGEIYTKLGLYESAQPLLDESLQLRRTRPEDASGLAQSLILQSALLLERGRPEEAEKRAREALELRRQSLGAETPEVSEAMGHLGSALLARDKLDEAEKMFRDVAALDAKLGIDATMPAIMRLENLAVLLEARGQRGEAEKIHLQTLAAARKTLGPEHPDLAPIIFNLGNLMRQMDRPAEAEPLLREALAIDRKAFGNENPSVASDLNVLGLVLRSSGKLDDAEGVLREALAIKRRTLGTEHPNVPPALNNLALVLGEAGRYDQAIALAREAVAIDRKVLGEEHGSTSVHTMNLAMLLGDAGHAAEAEPLARRALALRIKARGEDHPDVALGLARLGEILLARGNLKEAAATLEKAIAFPVAAVPAQSVPRALANSALGACLTRRGDYARAETLLREAQGVFEARSRDGLDARRVRQRLAALEKARLRP